MPMDEVGDGPQELLTQTGGVYLAVARQLNAKATAFNMEMICGAGALVCRESYDDPRHVSE